MNAILLSRPDDGFRFVDDEVIEEFLHELGILDKFMRNPEPGAEYFTLITEVYAHPTHYIIAVRLSEFPDPRDNGYIIECLPKSKVTLEDVGAAVKAMTLIFQPRNVVSGVCSRDRRSN